MILLDCGSTYAKVWRSLDGPIEVVKTKDLPVDFRADLATGHNAKRFADGTVNELIALAKGGQTLIEDPSFTLLDVGSRDIKYVRFVDGQYQQANWNVECGASMGFTIELLGSYFQIDFASLDVPEREVAVTCGVLGMSAIFDAIADGVGEQEAVARFVKGIARNAWRFAGSPEKLYLSGGVCENPFFLRCLPGQVIPLGRGVLLRGLAKVYEEQKKALRPEVGRR